MPVSRFLIPLVSTVWIFSVMGGMGMHVLAEQPTEVQAVRRQFSTLEEVTARRSASYRGRERKSASAMRIRQRKHCTRFRSRTAPWSSKN